MSRAAYLAEWRRKHPDNVAKHRVQHREYMRQNRGEGSGLGHDPLPHLFPDLEEGSTVSFWSEELAKDLRQEGFLAELENRDPVEAVRTYSSRENHWRISTIPLWEENE